MISTRSTSFFGPNQAQAQEQGVGVYLWGWGSQGQLGFGDHEARIAPTSLTMLSRNASRVCDVACGSRFTIAVAQDGSVFSFGKNDDGQLGHGSRAEQPTPRLVEALAKVQVIAVSARGAHALAIERGGFLWSWGRGDEGQLGHGSNMSSPVPGRISTFSPPRNTTFSPSRSMYKHAPSVQARAIAVACGRQHSVVLDQDGRVWTFGSGDDGALGHGDLQSCSSPHVVHGLDGVQVADIQCGSRHVVAVPLNEESGRPTHEVHQVALYTWGWGAYGQLGNGRKSSKSRPVPLVARLFTEAAVGISSHKSMQSLHSHDEVSESEARGHSESYDELGSTSSGGVGVVDDLSELSVVTVACGYRHTVVGVERNGEVSVWAWGWNQFGQCGQSSDLTHSFLTTPRRVGGASYRSVSAVTAGGRHTLLCAQTLDGLWMTYAWGRGDDGQLGIGSINSSVSKPTPIPALVGARVLKLASGWAHSGVLVDGLIHEHAAPEHEGMLARVLAPWMLPSSGDIDALIGQLLGALIQFMITINLCEVHAGIPRSMLLGRILPACGLSVFVGSAAFFVQSRQLAHIEGREDVTSQPHGISTVLFFAYTLMIMAPEYKETQSFQTAWSTGLFAATMTGVLELLSIFAIISIRSYIPRAALRASVAGVAFTAVTMGFAFQIFSDPTVAVAPLVLILISYGSSTRLPFRIPGTLGALLLGGLIAFLASHFLSESSHGSAAQEPYTFDLRFPALCFEAFLEGLTSGRGWRYISVIFPVTVVNISSNLAQIESAWGVGDRFDPRWSMAYDAIATIIGAMFGSPFPTGIYMGHPAFKAMGARSSYMFLNAAVVPILAFANLTGLVFAVLPMSAGVGFLLWVGVIITAQAFETDPSSANHTWAVTLGLIPCLASWALQIVTATVETMRGTGAEVTLEEVARLLDAGGSVHSYGLITLSQGYLLASIVFSSAMVHIIDRKFDRAAAWMLVASALSYIGMIHTYAFDPQTGAIVSAMGPPTDGRKGQEFTLLYILSAALLVFFHLRDAGDGGFVEFLQNMYALCSKPCAPSEEDEEEDFELRVDTIPQSSAYVDIAGTVSKVQSNDALERLRAERRKESSPLLGKV